MPEKVAASWYWRRENSQNDFITEFRGNPSVCLLSYTSAFSNFYYLLVVHWVLVAVHGIFHFHCGKLYL